MKRPHSFNAAGICVGCGLNLGRIESNDPVTFCDETAFAVATEFVAQQAASQIVMEYLRVTLIQPMVLRNGKMHFPRCEAERTGSYANDVTPRPTTPEELSTSRYRCKSSAKVDYAGQLLCIKHAQARALHQVMAPFQQKSEPPAAT